MQTQPQTQATFTMPSYDASVWSPATGLNKQRSAAPGTKVGTIERLMIDKASGKVAYAVLSFGGFMGVGSSAHSGPVEIG